MPSLRWRVSHALGVPTHVPSLREQAAAVFTALLGMGCVGASAWWLAPSQTSIPWLLTSMGASVVLVFGLPHGPLSQPWAVMGGHVLSAALALLCVLLFGSGVWQAALAVGLSIGAMHLARCIHPPGGATALFIVHSGATTQPTWWWLLQPVLLNVECLLLAAVVFNYPFSWRRYPASLAFRHVKNKPLRQLSHELPFTAGELTQALRNLDVVLDISDEQLQQLYDHLQTVRVIAPLMEASLQRGHFYSNGLNGENWAVRQIIDANAPDARKPQLIVKTVAGQGRGQVQLLSRRSFVAWARYEVFPSDDQWQRERVAEAA